MTEKEQCMKVLRNFEVEVTWVDGDTKTGKAVLIDGGEGDDKYYYYEPIVDEFKIITGKPKCGVEEQLDWVTTMCVHDGKDVQAIKSSDYNKVITALLK